MSSSSLSSPSSTNASKSDGPSNSKHRAKRKFEDSDSDSGTSSDDSTKEEENARNEPLPVQNDTPVLSHAAQRKQKKRAKLAEQGDTTEKSAISSTQNTNISSTSTLPKRQNSIWVGNLSFKTTNDALRKFFEEAGELTRVNMPTKLAAAAAFSAGQGKGWKDARTENRGFAYVDFSTPEAKTKAIAMSERNLDGRRLLIKDGGDFSNRPVTTASTSTPNPGTGHSKTAQRILSAQKRPPAPTLFVGNLGYEATEQSIRKMIEAHGNATAVFDKGKDKEKGKGRKRDTDLEDAEEGGEDPVPVDLGIKKVRVGQFEDSGLCKGFAFIDFATTEQATAALINPRNHHLDGRKLVLEYASADAVKRSGLHRDKDDKSSEDRGVRKSKKSRPDKQTRISMKEASRAALSGEDFVTIINDTNVDKTNEPSDSPKRKRGQQPRDGRSQQDRPKRRAKPGAALAQAQREKVAIVPSQGTRTLFP